MTAQVAVIVTHTILVGCLAALGPRGEAAVHPRWRKRRQARMYIYVYIIYDSSAKICYTRSLASLAVLNLSMLLKTHHSIRSNPPEGMIDENITMTMTNILWLGCHFFFVHLPCHQSFCSKNPGSFFPFFGGLLRPMASPDPFPKELRLMAWHSRARRIRRRASAPWMMAAFDGTGVSVCERW